MKIIHFPVLLQEVLEQLDPKPGRDFIDATVGEGGHAEALLQRTAPGGKLLGLDADPRQAEHAKNRLRAFGARSIVVNDSYVNVRTVARREGFGNVAGVLADLGMSSWQLEASGRGFTFQKDEPLDMRFGNEGMDAKEVVNGADERQLARILREYGEERYAERIAKALVRAREARPIATTFQLRDAVKVAVPDIYRRGRIHYATRTFQALRIAINHELEHIQSFLFQAVDLLAPGGRLAVISFHSLEDRIVKHCFQSMQNEGRVRIATKKPIIASAGEIRENPRSRSAKLRVITKK